MSTSKNKSNTKKQQLKNQEKQQANKTKEIEKLWLKGHKSAMERDIMSASEK